MDTYSILREFADSWFLIAMTAFFIGTIIWAFRPGSRKMHEDISEIPFRNETAADPSEVCKTSCDDCSCGCDGACLKELGVAQ